MIDSRRSGETSTAATVLGKVLTSHLEAHLPPYRLTEVVAGLHAAIVPLLAPPAVESHPAGLSKRELQVLIGMARGLSNGQISKELFLSEDTVKTYARRLYKAVGARDRAHAVARGYQLGVLLVDVNHG